MRCASLDADLIRRIANRDQEAAANLFDRYANEILGFLVRRTNATDGQDLLQEVFARALRGACRFRGDSSVRTWLYAIARHVLYERARSRYEGVTLASFADVRPGPESLTIGEEGRKRLLDAMERLPDQQAIVLELHRIDGLSHEEISKRLEIRPATSRKRLERAMQTLARAVQPKRKAVRVESWAGSLLRLEEAH